MSSYIKGEIDGAECIERLGRDGVAEIGSAMFATAGAALGGGSAALAIAGGLAGSMLGYAAAAAVYDELSRSLKEAKIARAERIRIERECAEAERMILQYRSEMNRMASRYFKNCAEVINAGFSEMDRAICSNDINGFIAGNVKIQKMLNYNTQFDSFEGFCDIMNSDVPFRL